MIGDACSVLGRERGKRLRVKAGEGARQLQLDICTVAREPSQDDWRFIAMHEHGHLNVAVEKHKGMISAKYAKLDQYFKTSHAAQSQSTNLSSESTPAGGLQS